MSPRVTVVYHSRGGAMRALAEAAAEGAASFGARVRLRRVADEAAPEAARSWPEAVASPDDVLWADGLVLATPTYFGNVSSPFKRFLESASALWEEAPLADRVVTGMTCATSREGGREATLLTLYQTAYRWGCWALGTEPGDPLFQGVGANPYGLSFTSGPDGRAGEPELTAAWTLGRRLADASARARTDAGAAPAGLGHSRVTVVHCAEDEPIRLLAQECAAGARELGARVRLRPVAGPGVPAESGLPGRTGGAPPAAPVTPQDVAWADAVVFGAPVRSGAVAAPLLGFLQALEPAAGPGPLAGKPAGGFVNAARSHSGGEPALLTLHQVLQHSGALVVPSGGAGPPVSPAGALPTADALAAARQQGRRIALAGDRLRRRTVPGGPRG
ncbi:hypothetical protein GCM10009544_62100 [Streptomyces stramineus]|uniref:Flavodoxin-like domain-containing protein n=1 Tax=Streptomyces stramineus TaxID=173861 RepID=A0ABP3L953_9ACTN